MVSSATALHTQKNCEVYTLFPFQLRQFVDCNFIWSVPCKAALPRVCVVNEKCCKALCECSPFTIFYLLKEAFLPESFMGVVLSKVLKSTIWSLCDLSLIFSVHIYNHILCLFPKIDLEITSKNIKMLKGLKMPFSALFIIFRVVEFGSVALSCYIPIKGIIESAV